MNDNDRKRRRSAKAYALDKKITQICSDFLKKGAKISARSVAKKAEISPSSITRDTIRSKIIAEAAKQQRLISETVKRQSKTARSKDAETIARQQMLIEDLQRKNHALLYSHKAMYNVIREVGGKEAWERFFETAQQVKQDIETMDNQYFRKKDE